MAKPYFSPAKPPKMHQKEELTMERPEVIRQLESLKQYTERLSGSNYTGKAWRQDTEALGYAIEFLKEHECSGLLEE